MTGKNKLIIVGAGFVGGTSYKIFSRLNNWDVKIHDRDPKNSFLHKTWLHDDLPKVNWVNELGEEGTSYTESVSSADLFVVALPTPMNQHGECHTGIFESAIEQIREVNKEAWICGKSTVPPGTTQRLYDKWGRVCFNPEFLTEANALYDFKSQRYQIIGSPEAMPGLGDSLDNLMFKLYEDCRDQKLLNIDQAAILDINSSSAEMVKYMRNTYLATRLSFFNEMKQICDAAGIDFDSTKWWAGVDPRMGHHYSDVRPESPGWGAHCLPKDVNAMMFFAKSLGVDPVVLEGVWNKNLEVRRVRDWEQMSNRAVIED